MRSLTLRRIVITTGRRHYKVRSGWLPSGYRIKPPLDDATGVFMLIGKRFVAAYYVKR